MLADQYAERRVLPKTENQASLLSHNKKTQTIQELSFRNLNRRDSTPWGSFVSVDLTSDVFPPLVDIKASPHDGLRLKTSHSVEKAVPDHTNLPAKLIGYSIPPNRESVRLIVVIATQTG